MPLNGATGAASPSCPRHPRILPLSNCRVATVYRAGICFFCASASHDFARFIGFSERNHPCFSVCIPASAKGFELVFYGVSVAGYCHQIFCRCHNFVCVIFTSRFRRGDCHSLVTTRRYAILLFLSTHYYQLFYCNNYFRIYYTFKLWLKTDCVPVSIPFCYGQY